MYQTRTAARLALQDPQDSRHAEHALHGFRYLRDVMWDRTHGGFFWLVDRSGAPLAGATKHAHSIAYGVQACAFVHAATGDSDALALAQESVEWLHRRAEDREGGGYRPWFTADGAVIRRREDIPPGAGHNDPVSHAIDLRDVNVHGDWFETYTDLAALHPSLAFPERLEMLAQLLLNWFTTPRGEIHFLCHPDGQPLPQPERFGYGFQAVSRLLSAPPLSCTPQLHQRAQVLLDRMLDVGTAPDGRGFVFAAAAGAPRELAGTTLVVPRRTWWVQLEAARALGHGVHRGWPNAAHYSDRLARHLAFITEELIDERHQGIFEDVRCDMPRGFWSRRLAMAKGNVWKDASHDADSLITLLRLLPS